MYSKVEIIIDMFAGVADLDDSTMRRIEGSGRNKAGTQREGS